MWVGWTGVWLLTCTIFRPYMCVPVCLRVDGTGYGAMGYEYLHVQLRPCFPSPTNKLRQRLQYAGLLKCFNLQTWVPSSLTFWKQNGISQWDLGTLHSLYNRHLVITWIWIIEPRHEISINVVRATSKASDQPAHTRSLIRGFASRLNILWVLS